MSRKEQCLFRKQIRTLYDEADSNTKDEGRRWYECEHSEARALARKTNLDVRLVCACLAILSPRCQWPRVKRACAELLSGKQPAGIFGHNRNKATAILHAHNGVPIDPRQAPKTWPFWQNLCHPKNSEP